MLAAASIPVWQWREAGGSLDVGAAIETFLSGSLLCFKLLLDKSL